MNHSLFLWVTLLFLISGGLIVYFTPPALAGDKIQGENKMVFVEWLGMGQIKKMPLPQKVSVLSELAVLYSKPTLTSEVLEELKVFTELTIVEVVQGDVVTRIATGLEKDYLHFNGCVMKSDVWAKVKISAENSSYVGYTPIHEVAAFPQLGTQKVNFLQLFKRYLLSDVNNEWNIGVRTAHLPLLPSHPSLFDKIGFENLFPKLIIKPDEVIISFPDLTHFLNAHREANHANIEIVGCTPADYEEDEYCYRTPRESDILLTKPLVVFAFNDSGAEKLDVKELIYQGVFADEPIDLSPNWPLRYKLSTKLNFNSVLLFITPEIVNKIDSKKVTVKKKQFVESGIYQGSHLEIDLDGDGNVDILYVNQTNANQHSSSILVPYQGEWYVTSFWAESAGEERYAF